MNLDRIKSANRTAVEQSVGLARQVNDQDLSLPTPCSKWTLGDLLAHMTAQHRGFAASARGAGNDLIPWTMHPLGVEAVKQYGDAADDVMTAFAAVETPDQQFALPEFTTDRTFPAVTAIGFHFIDYLVHSWDVAATLGIAFDPAPELIDVGLPIALAIPQGASRLQPGSSFQPVLSVADGASTLDRILAAVGRSPTWRP